MILTEAVIVIDLITTGLDVVIKIFDLYRNDLIKPQNDLAALPSFELKNIESLINDSTDSIKKAIQESTDKIIDKIEQEKLEELVSRIKNTETILRAKRDIAHLSYVLSLQESVDYAQYRVKENKQHWYLPYVAGKTMVTMAYAHLGEEKQKQQNATKELKQIREDAKSNLLNEVVPKLLQSGKTIPWDMVSDILSNKPKSADKLLSLSSSTQSFDFTGEWVLTQLIEGVIDPPTAKVYLTQNIDRLYGVMIVQEERLRSRSGRQFFLEGLIKDGEFTLNTKWEQADDLNPNISLSGKIPEFIFFDITVTVTGNIFDGLRLLTVKDSDKKFTLRSRWGNRSLMALWGLRGLTNASGG